MVESRKFCCPVLGRMIVAGLILLAVIVQHAKGGEEAKTDDLLIRLENDFRRLVNLSDNPQPLMEAARLLKETNDNTHWTNYSKATAILKKNRSRAAVPLLLKYMVVHMQRSSRHVMIPAYAETLTVLTGKDIPSPYRSGPDGPKQVRQAVQKLVDDWWSKDEKSITTEIGLMKPKQIQQLVSQLVEKERSAGEYRVRSRSGEDRATAYSLYHVLYYHVMHRGESADRRNWAPDDLHASMLPFLLQESGYRKDPQNRGQQESKKLVPLEVVGMLAHLRENGEAENLDEIAEDVRQDSAARLVCAMAIYRAGEPLNTETILTIVGSEKVLERRLIAILALRHTSEPKLVVPVLLKQLDDRNVEIATAAACALRDSRPPEALPKLEKLINATAPGLANVMLFKVLGSYRSKESQRILADYLQEALAGGEKERNRYTALSAFEDATGQRWSKAGVQSPEQRKMNVVDALEWWKANQENAINEGLAVRAVAVAAAHVEAAKVMVIRQTAVSQRMHKLFARGVVSATALQEVDLELKMARQELAECEKKLDAANDKLKTVGAKGNSQK